MQCDSVASFCSGLNLFASDRFIVNELFTFCEYFLERRMNQSAIYVENVSSMLESMKPTKAKSGENLYILGIEKQ